MHLELLADSWRLCYSVASVVVCLYGMYCG